MVRRPRRERPFARRRGARGGRPCPVPGPRGDLLGPVLSPRRADAGGVGVLRDIVSVPRGGGFQPAKPRQRPCRAPRVGHRRLRRQAHIRQPLGHVGQHSRLSTEEMSAAGHIQRQRAGPRRRRVEPHPRGIASRPARQRGQEVRLPLRFGRAGGEVWQDDPRIGQRHAAREACAFRRRVQRDQRQRALLLRRHGEGRFDPAGPARHAFGRQPGEPERDDAPGHAASSNPSKCSCYVLFPL